MAAAHEGARTNEPAAAGTAFGNVPVCSLGATARRRVIDWESEGLVIQAYSGTCFIGCGPASNITTNNRVRRLACFSSAAVDVDVGPSLSTLEPENVNPLGVQIETDSKRQRC